MSVVRGALSARRLIEENAALTLLRSANAPAAIAILGEHLAGETRELPAAELFEAAEADLSELRDTGRFELPQTAVQYVRTWLTQGFLIRRAGQAREEFYALSDGALAAIRFIQELSAPRSSVTESRLSTIVDRVHRLTVDTDPDTTRRIESLRGEREKLDQRIAALEAGEVETLSQFAASEQATDVLALASELPEDFVRLRSELEEINRGLRIQLIEEPDSRGAVLEDIFRGVDLLQESEAGKSFTAFYALILDPERTAAVEDDVDQLLHRPFANSLTPGQRHGLRRLLPAMQDSSSEIHTVMTSLSRSLRRFVQSQELAEDRMVNDLIRRGLAEANQVFAAGVQPYQVLDLDLGLTGVPVASVSALKLHNPADSAGAEAATTAEAPPVDLEQLRASVREAEIDMTELKTNVAEVLNEHGTSTIAEILHHRPATQGAASVIGLLVLAEELGSQAAEGSEEITWSPAHSPQAVRRGRIPLYLFERSSLD
ncbi:DUF3375 domain-containing protein [Garicola koreensis]